MVEAFVSETPKSASNARLRQAGVVALVGLAHAGMFAAIGMGRVESIVIPAPTPIAVELVRPPPPPPPPPPPTPSPVQPGGGAPAAPSRVHVTPKPPEIPPELPAPPKPAPRPTLVVGAAPTASLNVGLGQGGEGTGTGSGTGEGDGPGSGSGPIILRGASNGEILPFVPPEARRRRIPGRAEVRCTIRSDSRLDACRVVSESPSGLGFGEAAARVAEAHFRVRPATTGSGRVVEGGQFTVGVNFGRQGG